VDGYFCFLPGRYSCVTRIQEGWCWRGGVGRSDTVGWNGFEERYFVSYFLSLSDYFLESY